MSICFGKLIRKYRTRAGWSQRELAVRAGLGESSHNLVSKLETSQEVTLEARGRGASCAVAQAIIKALDEHRQFTWAQLQELAVAYLVPEEWRPEERRIERGETPVIGLIVPSIDGSSFWSRVVGAIESAAVEAHYMIVLSQHLEDATYLLEHLKFFQNVAALAGLIMAPAVGITSPSSQRNHQVDEILATLRERDIPVVFIDRRVPTRKPIPYVGLDNNGAAYRAVSRLITDGHTRIGALFALPQTSTQQERHAGYRQALERAGLYDKRLVKWGEEVSRHQRESHRQAHGVRRGFTNTKELLSLPEKERPTAIFCGTYYMAVEAARAIEALDISPDTITLMGFDQVDELDILNIPRVVYPVVDLGRAAVRKILALAKDSHDPHAQQDVILPALEITEKNARRAPKRPA